MWLSKIYYFSLIKNMSSNEEVFVLSSSDEEEQLNVETARLSTSLLNARRITSDDASTSEDGSHDYGDGK